LNELLAVLGVCSEHDPLFIALDNRGYGKRLSGRSIDLAPATALNEWLVVRDGLEDEPLFIEVESAFAVGYADDL
jgi:ribosome modulation factor